MGLFTGCKKTSADTTGSMSDTLNSGSNCEYKLKAILCNYDTLKEQLNFK